MAESEETSLAKLGSPTDTVEVSPEDVTMPTPEGRKAKHVGLARRIEQVPTGDVIPHAKAMRAYKSTQGQLEPTPPKTDKQT